MGDEPTGLLNYLPRLGRTFKDRIGKALKKGTRRGGKVKIGPLKKGKLTNVGYSVGSKATTRHLAVDRAVKKYGRLSTLRKLNAVRVFTRRTSPVKSRKFKSDVRYVQKKYY
jgi:hypothetical protein